MSEADVIALRREVKRLRYELSVAVQQLPYLRDMVEGSRDGLALLDEAGRVLECNHALGQVLGLPVEHLIQGSIATWPWAPGEGRRWDDTPTLLEGFATGVPVLAMLASGDTLELVLARAPSPGPAVYVASARKLTDLGAAARALLESRTEVRALQAELSVHKRFGTLFEHSPDALVLFDGEGIVQLRNAWSACFWPELEVGTSAAAAAPDIGAVLESLRQATAGVPEGRRWLLDASSNDDARELDARLSHVVLPQGHGFLLSARDVTERRRAERALQQALEHASRSVQEREVLLQEVHHRVKNNLQIVSSLLAMQGDQHRSAEARAALEDAVGRVRSMALVHQLLYSGHDFSRIELGGYAESLVTQLMSALDPAALVQVEVEQVLIDIDRAIPCGLVLNELLMNALKHGRSADGVCRARVRIRSEAGWVEVRIEDEGPGTPVDRVSGEHASMGMRVVAALVRQLRGALDTRTDMGTCVVLRFPA